MASFNFEALHFRLRSVFFTRFRILRSSVAVLGFCSVSIIKVAFFTTRIGQQCCRSFVSRPLYTPRMSPVEERPPDPKCEVTTKMVYECDPTRSSILSILRLGIGSSRISDAILNFRRISRSTSSLAACSHFVLAFLV